MHVQFDSLVDEARVWVFPLLRPISNTEAEILSHEMFQFVTNWKAHGSDVSGSFWVVENQFIVVAADITATEVSGCSIDSLFKAVSQGVEKISNAIADPSTIYYRNQNCIRAVARSDFKLAVDNGEVTSETVVFDPTIIKLSDVRAGKFEKRAADSWHKQAFFRG